MQAVRIWYHARRSSVSLEALKAYLEMMGCVVEDHMWQLGDTRIPQLKITSPAEFHLQIDAEEWVAEEAREFAEIYQGMLSRAEACYLSAAIARLEIDTAADPVVVTDDAVSVFAGATTFDPTEPEVAKILKLLGSYLSGVVEDNVNGQIQVFMPAPPKRKPWWRFW